MKERSEQLGTAAHGGAVKPERPAGEEQRRFQDAIEDDEVREALGEDGTGRAARRRTPEPAAF